MCPIDALERAKKVYSMPAAAKTSNEGYQQGIVYWRHKQSMHEDL